MLHFTGLCVVYVPRNDLHELRKRSQPIRRGCQCTTLLDQPFVFCGQFEASCIFWIRPSTCRVRFQLHTTIMGIKLDLKRPTCYAFS